MRVPLSSHPTTLAIYPCLDPLSPIFTVCFLTVTTCTPVYSHSLWAVDFKQDLAVFFQSIPWPTSKHFALWSFRLVLPLHRGAIKLISYETFIILIIQNDFVPLLQVHVQGCNNIYCKCLEYKHSLPQNSSLYTNLLDTQTPKSGQLNHPTLTVWDDQTCSFLLRDLKVFTFRHGFSLEGHQQVAGGNSLWL